MPPQRRTPGTVRVEDLWHRRDDERSARYGKGKRWQVRWVDDTRRERSKSFSKRVQADQFRDRLTSEFTRGQYRDPNGARSTVGELFEAWLPLQVHLKPASVATRQSSWRCHVQPTWGDREVGSVRKSDVQLWVSRMAADGTGTSTIELALVVLRGVLSYAVDADLIAASPAAAIRVPRQAPRRHPYLTVGQVDALAWAAGDYGPVIRLLAYTGIRWGEMSALRPDAVNLDRCRLSIHRADGRTAAGGVLDGAPKTGKSRSVSIIAPVAEDLRTAMEGKAQDARIFTAPEGGPLVGDNFRSRQWAKAVDDACLLDPTFPADLTPHDLRHTAASLMVRAGANVKAVQRQLGHASATVTLDVYADLFDDDLDDVAARLSKLVESGA